MKNITLMMCLIAAVAIFTLPADAARRVNQSIPITLSVPVPCAGEVVDLNGTLNTVIKFMRGRTRNSANISLHVNTQDVAVPANLLAVGIKQMGTLIYPLTCFSSMEPVMHHQN